MHVQLTASTTAKILVWREDELFHARLHETTGPIQVCLGVDLFEVIAELAGLDLEQGDQAAEAMTLADRALISLGEEPLARIEDGEDEDDLWISREPVS